MFIDPAPPVNLTQHTFFNLACENGGSVLGHEVQILASRFTPVDPGLIPTGDLRCVDGTEMDFREPHRIGDRIDSGAEQLVLGGGYDHTWVVDRSGPGLVPAGRVR